MLHDNQSILDDDNELLYALSGRRLDLEIYVSLISNYYYFFIIETKFLNNKLSFNYHEVKEFISVNQAEHLDKKFNFMGYIRLERNIASLDVPNVETELLYAGEIKVFNCLFSDMEKHF